MPEQHVDASLDPAAPGGELRQLPVSVEGLHPRPIEPAGSRELSPRAPAALPSPALAAAGGFLAGIVTFILARALRPSSRGVRLRRARRRDRAIEVAGSRSFLVDVHLLKR